MEQLKFYKVRREEGLSDEFLERLPHLPPSMMGSSGVMYTASLYFPDISAKSASRALRREIETYPALRKALEATNWSPQKRILTPLQLQIILFYLGEPV